MPTCMIKTIAIKNLPYFNWQIAPMMPQEAYGNHSDLYQPWMA